MARSWARIARGGPLAGFALFLTVTAGLIAVIGGQIAHVPMGGHYTVRAAFDDVSGLRAGDQVKIAGVPVGQVEDIAVVSGRAEVTMAVGEDVRLPADSAAAIRWRDTIGRRVVYLLPGRSGDHLRDGSRIGSTTSAVDIGELIGDLGPLTRGLDPEQINRLLTAAAEALDGNQANIPALVGHLDDLTGTVASRRELIRGMLKDYASVAGVIAGRDRQIAGLIDDLVVLTGAFADNRELVDDALVELSATVGVTGRVVGGNARELGAVVDRLAGLTGGVRREIGRIERVVAALPPPLRRSYEVTGRGRFTTAAVPCLSPTPVPCPFPMRTPPRPRPTARLDDAAGLRRVLVGGG
ncbi:MCE family protein [Spongiactinospora sp. TRM90649]|uniref:MCE family protein n=1 Tax=Spongiactinospora sp. TRM90649 TaxID=3031114 RepID=UPI0023F7013F|nr:MCE family protein [Spongiactinospora sp. TRM90649]MDF5755905.1 MCE family protein [Spongiactinospora sp. TRM90649]